jgi:hypothetical protein
MAKDTVNTDIKEKGHEPDKARTDVGGKSHCEHCADHHARLSTVETLLGVKVPTQPGAAAEETGKSQSREPSREPNRERQRH